MSASFLEHGATLEDLLAFDGDAELIDGRIVPMTGSGYGPSRAAFHIASNLYLWEREHGGGRLIPDPACFLVHTPREQVLCRDVVWWTGTPDPHAPVIQGAPVFAVEVRSTTDCGPFAEKTMERKRALWFAAGVQVLWEVDVLRRQTIRVFHADAPDAPVVYSRGETADAEPAIPDWRFPVGDLFE